MKLGHLYATWNIDVNMQENKKFRDEVNESIGRFISNDWGEICPEDATLNDLALNTNERIIASYETCKGEIWIISDYGREATTVLFPSEY